MPLTTGDLLAERYLLGEIIGSGGMAEVYRAEDRILHREVAVKLLRESTDTETDRARFASEARTLAGLTHPGLVTVLDAGITTTHPFLVMELVRGETLAQQCAAGGLPSKTVTDIGVQLAQAVAFAHRHHIIHRDLKPGNVLITATGRVKLADFGIARLIGDTTRHTQTGQAIGTAAYLAPEQVRGEELTSAADVYSLALVLLEALTGERAFPGPATEAALARLSRPPVISADLPPMWRQLLASMTSAEVMDRPSAAEVAAILAGPPATAPTPLEPSGPTPASTAVMTHLTDLATSPVAPVSLPSPARGRGLHPWMISGLIAVAVLIILLAALVASGGQDEAQPQRPVPSGVPTEFVAPLQDLHDAVGDAS
ncbi:hypothetical protein GCM10027020_25140 [Nocardioides salsibiostraticola]